MLKQFLFNARAASRWMSACFLFIISIQSQILNAQSYNQLWIPDTLSGTNFNLTLQDTFKQFLPGQQTITEGINGNWWGPTLFFNKGDTVHLNIINHLQDTTTVHWHGIHLPAAMDGGPHQPIAPMATWSPYFKVMNKAATYWYHPHLHMMTEQQMMKGMGGLVIIRDSIESSLNLPRTYGVDDIPLVLTDRRFDTTVANLNQLVLAHLGDTMMVNGTLYPEYNVPAQVVRFRILNTALERGYKFGFSDSTAFSVIATDGGLLNTPVNITNKRFLISPGERVEILVNLTGRQGQTLDLVAYNGSLPPDIPGSTPGIGSIYNLLGGRDFLILHLNIVAPTANPVMTFPSSLTTNTFWTENSATTTRHIVLSDVPDSLCPPDMEGCAWFDSTFFDINVINYRIRKDSIEIWELENKSNYFSHPFHMHGLQFCILDRNGTLPPSFERGWKDVVAVRKNMTVRLIAKFEDYADSIRPFMYHCHTLFHEDAGMMGQFVVVDTSLSVGMNGQLNNAAFSVYPNPANDELHIDSWQLAIGKTNTLKVYDILGNIIYSASSITSNFKLQTLNFLNGIYFIQLINDKSSATQKLIIQH